MGPGTGPRARSRRLGAALIVTEQRRERGDMIGGKWIASKEGREHRSRNAVRRITTAFWRILGLEVEADLQREWHAKRLRKKQARADSLAAATLVQVVGVVSARTRRRGPVYTPPVAPPPGRNSGAFRPRPESREAATWDELARFRALYDDLERENPTWPAADLARRADELLQAEKTR
jgi:hypothetical protein